MKRPTFDTSSPKSWQHAIESDGLEFWGSDIEAVRTTS
jgi:hypothetical protein